MSEMQNLIDKLEEHTEADRKQFESIDTRLDNIHDTLKNVESLLIGNEKLKRKGLVVMVDEHEELVKKGKWMVVLITALVSSIAFFFSQIGDFFKNHL